MLGDVSKYEVGRDGRDLIPNSDLISDTGGLRKVRFADRRLGTGKRGGFRVIYYWWGATQIYFSRLNTKVMCRSANMLIGCANIVIFL